MYLHLSHFSAPLVEKALPLCLRLAPYLPPAAGLRLEPATHPGTQRSETALPPRDSSAYGSLPKPPKASELSQAAGLRSIILKFRIFPLYKDTLRLIL